jgi:iron complex transport system substrate-binding protein
MIRALATASMVVILAGCSVQRPAQREAGSSGSPRVISLAPSLTEIAYVIGCGDRLVGDTLYDNYPPQAKRLPHVADLAHADLERIAQLRPTAILALHDQEKEGAQIAARIPVQIQYLPNRNLDDLYTDVEGVGAACDLRARASAYEQGLRDSIKRTRCAQASGPRVFVLLGLPGFSVGRRSYINDLIELAGGRNVAADIDQPYPNLGAEAILKADPDIVMVSNDTPFGADVQAREPWRSLRAVREQRIIRPPNDDVIERNGPRVLEGLRWLKSELCLRH